MNTFAHISIQILSNKVPDSNVLYRGVENIIKISGTDQNSEIVSRQSRIKSRDRFNEFRLIPMKSGSDTLEIFRNKKRIFSQIFRVDSLPPMRASLGNLRDIVVSKALILANGIVKLYLPGLLLKFDVYISSFSTIFQLKSGESSPTLISSRNRFSEEQIKTIQGLKSGDRIVFSEIRCSSPGSTLRTIPDKFFIEVT